MAKTVAEIDGDSSGLVSELGKAKGAMGDLGTQGKKLSDQLKDVADQADVAAGNLVNALGGPGAIKAIGGVGIAFAGVKAGVDAFMDSAENMFRSMGDEGQAVWDQVEKSLFAIKGSFAEAVIGSDDMYEAGGRLQAMFEVVKDALDAVFDLLKPLTVAMTGLLELTTDYGDKAKVAADKLRQQADAQTKVKESGDLAATSIQTLKEKMMALRGETENLRDIQLASYQMDAKMTAQRILDTERVADEAEAKAALVARQEEVFKLTTDQVGMMAQYGAIENTQEARDAAYVERYKLNSATILAEEMKKREGLSASRKAEYDQATALYLEFERMRLTNEGAPGANGKTGTGGGGGTKEPTAQERIEAALAKAKAEADALATLKEQNDRTEQQLELDKLKAELERIDAHNAEKAAKAQEFLDYTKQMELDHIAEIHARGELTAEEQDELNAQRLQAVQDRAGQEMGIYAQVAGKQLALGKLSAKTLADQARQQLGNVIMGLGDKAMAEAGIMAAALDPRAFAMFAAGTTAYTIGGALAADKKGSGGNTPATEKEQKEAPAPNNYAFNLRVDSVFADGESVARQFAMMQESARQRGLLAQGAF